MSKFVYFKSLFCVHFDFETPAFMARASKIIIILRLKHHTRSYFYLTLTLECSRLERQRLLLFWLWGWSVHGLSLKDFIFQAWASYLSLLLFDFDAWVFMAWASKIIIILTLRLKRLWLNPQRLLCLIIIQLGYGKHNTRLIAKLHLSKKLAQLS